MKKLSAMKTIEDIIRNNRDLFEDEEPSEGHFERFSVKLEIRCHARAKRSIVPYLLKSSSGYTSGYTFISLDMGSFHPPGKQQNDSRPGISTVQRG